MSGKPEPVVNLGHNVTAQCSFPADNSVEGRLWWSGQPLADAVLSPGNASQSTDMANALMKSHSQIDVDFFGGEMSVALTVATPGASPTDPWIDVADVKTTTVAWFDPCVGLVKDSPFAPAPKVDQKWGPSGTSAPGVTRIHVDEQHRQLTDVGRMVKNLLFADHPPFTFNTLACCGQVPDGKPGVYSDPTSIWFNVFFGIYQLDAGKADGWKRPFGYETADGVQSAIHGEDIVRLGKSDWNWFSNYMYGVPASVCTKYSTVDLSTISFSATETKAIGASHWHSVTMSGIEVASCYESNVPGASKLVENTDAEAIWESTFGLPCPRPEFPVSFIPTKLIAGLNMTYWEDDAAYHTLVFGGTAGVGSDPAFLGDQMSAVAQLIEQSYPTAGFTKPA